MIEFLRFFHLLFAFTLLAGVGIAAIIPPRAATIEDPSRMLILYRISRFAERFLITPSIILLGIFGVWAAYVRGHPLDSAWLVLAYIGGVVALALHGYLSKNTGRLVRALEADLEAGRGFSNTARGIRDNPRIPAAAGVLLLLTTFLLVDMVFKPF